MPAHLDVGATFGHWTVIGPAQHLYFRCRCTCGNERVVYGHSLVKGASQSCGCWTKPGWANRVHGQTGSPEYMAWQGAKRRCYQMANPAYPMYGARGIAVCDRWRDSFEAFYADMGPRPSKAHSLDRIDNDGPYSPDNCRWATKTEQARNRCSNAFLEHNGERLTIAEWAPRLGAHCNVINMRINNRKWSVARAVTEPVHR